MDDADRLVEEPAASPSGETRSAAELSDSADALLEAVKVISSDLDLHGVLTRIVESATTLTGARYGALGVVGPQELLVDFVNTGLTETERNAIGELPHGRGILGLLIRDPRPIRLGNLADHPASFGFPPHHPPMGTFLGVPVRIRGTVFGNLYLTEKAGGGEFTDADEQLVVALAGVAGLVIENARAYGRSERRRQWLQAAAELSDSLQPPVDWALALGQIASQARRAAGVMAAAVIDAESGHLLAIDEESPGDEAVRAALDGVRAQLAGIDLVDAVDVSVGSLMCRAVPLHAHLARGGLLVMVEDAAGSQPRDVDDGALMLSFADYAALALDRGLAMEEREELAITSDRERIARDLHDVVIQRLFAAGMQLKATSIRATSDDTRQGIERSIADLDATIRDVRATIFELKTPRVGSLRAELNALVSEYRSVLGYVPRFITTGPVDTVVPERLHDPLLRVVREAVSNAARHAQASKLDVHLDADAGRVVLTISDDGVGITPGGTESGLRNLRERARALGGHLALETNDPHGVRLSWSVPLDDGPGGG